MSAKRVAVIGAGPAGLVTGKSLIEVGLHPVIFDRSDRIGGMWDPAASRAWKSLRTNLSKHTCRFSDHPWPADAALFPAHQEMHNYLISYAQRFLVSRPDKCTFHWNCAVLHINNAAGSDSSAPTAEQSQQQYEVRWRNEHTSESHSELFDGVYICSGLMSHPFIPVFNGIKHYLQSNASSVYPSSTSDTTATAAVSAADAVAATSDVAMASAVDSTTVDVDGSVFSGLVLHGSEYTSAAAFTGKNVLVVGASYSAIEIAAEVAATASSVINVLPAVPWIIPRMLPMDSNNPATPFLPLDLVFYTNRLHTTSSGNSNSCSSSNNNNNNNNGSSSVGSNTSGNGSSFSSNGVASKREVIFKTPEALQNTHDYIKALFGCNAVASGCYDSLAALRTATATATTATTTTTTTAATTTATTATSTTATTTTATTTTTIIAATAVVQELVEADQEPPSQLQPQRQSFGISENYNTLVKLGRIEPIAGRLVDFIDGQFIVKSTNRTTATNDSSSSSSSYGNSIIPTTCTDTDTVTSIATASPTSAAAASSNITKDLRIAAVDVDAVILCTGYRPNVSFLAKNILQRLQYDAAETFSPFILHREIMHPQCPGLYFIGMYKAPYFATMELQARLTAAYHSGNIPLPTAAEMRAGLEVASLIRQQPLLSRPQFPHTDYVGMLLDLATDLGMYPPVDMPSTTATTTSVPAAATIATTTVAVTADCKSVNTSAIVTPIDFPPPGADNCALQQQELQQLQKSVDSFTSGRRGVAGAVFRSLVGKWRFERRISDALSQSTSTVTGTINFSSTHSHSVDSALLYTEEGKLKLPNVPGEFDVKQQYIYSHKPVTETIVSTPPHIYCASNAATVAADSSVVGDTDQAVDELVLYFCTKGSAATPPEIDYHFLTLRNFTASPTGWVARAYHPCGDDHYNAEYRFSFAGLTLAEVGIDFVVKGPKKNYLSSTTLRR